MGVEPATLTPGEGGPSSLAVRPRQAVPCLGTRNLPGSPPIGTADWSSPCGRPAPCSPVIKEITMPVPQVPKPGGGKQERDRNNDGEWRHKRSDAGKPRSTGSGGGPKKK